MRATKSAGAIISMRGKEQCDSALHNAAVKNTIAQKVYNQLKKNVEKSADAFVRGEGYALVAIMAYLRSGEFDNKPFGKKRLNRFAKGVIEYTKALNENHADMIDTIAEFQKELGWNIIDAFKEAEEDMLNDVYRK